MTKIRITTGMQLQQLQLRQRQKLRAPVSPVSILSLYELEDVLAGLTVEELQPTGREQRSSGYFWPAGFIYWCHKSRRSVLSDKETERYLAFPQILVEHGEGSDFSVRHNSNLRARLEENLRRFESEKYRELLKNIRRERNWMEEQQLRIMQYVCNMQEQYIREGTMPSISPLHQENIVEALSRDRGSVSRLLRHLTVSLPEPLARTMFAQDLIPTADYEGAKAVYHLDQLQHDSHYFDTKKGKWKVSGHDLRLSLQLYLPDIAPRTLRKYREMLAYFQAHYSGDIGVMTLSDYRRLKEKFTQSKADRKR